MYVNHVWRYGIYTTYDLVRITGIYYVKLVPKPFDPELVVQTSDSTAPYPLGGRDIHRTVRNMANLHLLLHEHWDAKIGLQANISRLILLTKKCIKLIVFHPW
jgi:hypothetical protein